MLQNINFHTSPAKCAANSTQHTSNNRVSGCFGWLCSEPRRRQEPALRQITNSTFSKRETQAVGKLFAAIKEGKDQETEKLLKYLFDHHIDINGIRLSGLGLLHVAAKKEDTKMLSLLLSKHQLNPDVLDDMREPRSPLFYAANGGNYQAAVLLCEANTSTSFMSQALQEAINNGHTDIEQLLTKKLTNQT